jgi:hypothetical protein
MSFVLRTPQVGVKSVSELTVKLVFTLPTVNLILMAVPAAAHVSPEGPPKERFRRVADDITRQVAPGRACRFTLFVGDSKREPSGSSVAIPQPL